MQEIHTAGIPVSSFGDSWTRFVAGVFFPLQEKLKRHDSSTRRRFLESSQWWDQGRIERHQLTKLKDLLSCAERHVPYYRALFKETGFNAGDLKSLAGLEQLPFLTKAVIRSSDLKSEIAGPLQRFNTGGSSGEPLIFFLGERVSHDVAAKWRATRWWGVDIGDPEIVVWGSPIELAAQDRVRQLRDRIMRTELLPAFEMTEAKLDKFLTRIRAREPKMLFGYPSALAHIARHALKRGMRMDDLGIKVAFVTAEQLYPDQREVIGRTFGCPVANGYGARDAGFIAHECSSGGMHITAEDIIVEIVDAAGKVLPPGQAGEIVVTHLATQDFPFIRYRTGDIAVMDDRRCDCGRGLPLLKEVQGRTTDFLVAQDGTVMHGLALVYVLRDLPGIAAFKVTQESLDLTVVRIVREDTFASDSVERITAAFKQRLGPGVNVQVEMVDQILPEASGKFRYIISKVPAPSAKKPEAARA